jgi:vacuolar-type H+-ATPase subunit I/STV1
LHILSYTDAEQSARIRLLEQWAEFSDKKLQEISTTNEKLLKSLVNNVDKLNQKDDIIQQLQSEVKQLQSLLDVQEKTNQEINSKKQEPDVQEWKMRKNEKSLITSGRIRQTDSRKHSESTKTNEATEPIIYNYTQQLQSSDYKVAPMLKGNGAVSITNGELNSFDLINNYF